MKKILVFSVLTFSVFTLKAQEIIAETETIMVSDTAVNVDTVKHTVMGDKPEINKAGDTTKIRLGRKGITIIEKDGKTTVHIDKIGSDKDGDEIADKDIDIEKDEADNDDDNDHHHGDNHRFNPHFSGVELNLNNYLTASNSMTLPANAAFMELNTNKSIGVRVNIIEYEIPITSEQGFYTGLGFEFNSYSFDSKNNIKKENGKIVAKYKDGENPSSFEKNKLKDTYLNVPLMYELQFPMGNSDKPLYIAGGVIGGIKIGSSTKEEYSMNGKDKSVTEKDDFYLAPFRYGVQAKVGFRYLHLVATYYPTALFQTAKGPELHPFDLGFMLVNF